MFRLLPLAVILLCIGNIASGGILQVSDEPSDLQVAKFAVDSPESDNNVREANASFHIDLIPERSNSLNLTGITTAVSRHILIPRVFADSREKTVMLRKVSINLLRPV